MDYNFPCIIPIGWNYITLGVYLMPNAVGIHYPPLSYFLKGYSKRRMYYFPACMASSRIANRLSKGHKDMGSVASFYSWVFLVFVCVQ